MPLKSCGTQVRGASSLAQGYASAWALRLQPDSSGLLTSKHVLKAYMHQAAMQGERAKQLLGLGPQPQPPSYGIQRQQRQPQPQQPFANSETQSFRPPQQQMQFDQAALRASSPSASTWHAQQYDVWRQGSPAQHSQLLCQAQYDARQPLPQQWLPQQNRWWSMYPGKRPGGSPEKTHVIGMQKHYTTIFRGPLSGVPSVNTFLETYFESLDWCAALLDYDTRCLNGRTHGMLNAPCNIMES